MALEQEPIGAAAPGDSDKEAVEEQTFNQNSRDEMEEAFEAFQQGAEEPTAPATAAPVTDKLPDERALAPTAAVITEEPRTTFKTLEDADKSYLEVRRKWNESTERANRLERERDEADRRASEAIGLAMKSAQGGERTAPPPNITKEALEAKFFEDPVGFMLSITEAANQDAIRKVESRAKSERQAMAAENITNHTQAYFDTNYADLKALEPLVIEEIQRISRDPDTIRPILDDKNARMDVKAKALVDEASRRVRDRIPGIVAGFGATTGETIKKRLPSGAPPLVPGGGRSGPSIKADVARTEGETNEEYIAGRHKIQDRMQVTRWTR